MKNKVLAAVLVAATAVMMTAGSVSAASYAEDAKIKVWGSQEDQEMLQGIITSFKEKYPEAANWTIETAVVSSADAKTEVLKDPAVAADVFEFASDQIAELQSAGVLYKVTKNKAKTGDKTHGYCKKSNFKRVLSRPIYLQSRR